MCGSMMHSHNPFADTEAYSNKINNLIQVFPEWLTKIYLLIAHHQITLVGGKAMVVGLLERTDNGQPQAVILEQID
mgnify:CR=1 FL=1